MNKTNRLLWSFIALAWAAWVVSFLFLHITRDPGHRIITVIGDAPKNYYTYLYHILYEKGFWFGGMNYPYGELLVYTDAQPLLSVPLAWLNHNGVPVTRETALAVMHLCMAGSFVLGIFFTYRSLLFFGLRHWAALAFATVIILLSPQVFRILGHFALSYASFLPMLFYFSMRYHYSSRVKYAIYILLLSITMYFIHPYYVAMSLIWCGCYFLGYLLLTRNTGRKEKLRHLAPFLGATLGILVFVSSFMALADHATDRPTYPYGTTTYVTRFKDIFTSWHSPLWQRMQEKGWVEATGNNQDEGYAYMGLAVMLILSVALILALVRLFRKKQTAVINSNPATPATGIWLFIALAALTLSMGVPFIWNMEWLLDYMSLFRQFRTLGRFSWIFQYTISIYAVVTLYRWYSSLQARNRKVPAWLVLLFPLLLWAYEALPYVKVIRHISHHSGNLYKEYFLTEGENWEQFLGQHHYKKDDFQGLLLLPFIHVGSEKLAVGAQGGWLLYMSCKASVTLQLPIVDVMMSRSSWSQAEGQVRIAGGPFADKPLLRDIKSDKPFLLMQFEVDPITPDEAYLLSCSDHIGHFSQCHVYACYPERIRKQDQFLRHSALSELPQRQADTCSNCNGTWYVNHFDDHPQELRLAGAGALPPIKTADSLLAEVSIKPLSDSVEYEWSTWVLMGKDYRTPYFTVTMLDSAGKELFRKDALAKESVDNKGLWFRTAVFFKVPVACRKLQWWVHNDTQKTSYLALDELLLRPANATVCSRRDDSTILVNNHLIR